MAKTITQLPDATSVADSDELIVQQSGITKRASKLEVLAGIKNASIASDAAIAASKLQNPQYTGFRNAIINGNFAINQRAVTGTVTLAAGAYGHDRWKAGSSGCTYTFATSGNVTTLTISAGSIIQVIEGSNLYNETYVLSWTGTAQGKIGAGSFAASGVTGSATGGTNLSIEFNTGTVSLVQFEAGSVATPFERRPIGTELALCQRYYWKTFPAVTAPAQNAGVAGSYVFGQLVSGAINCHYPVVPFPVEMRANPTLTLFNPSAANAQVRNIAAGADYSSTTISASTWGFLIAATGPAGGTAGQASVIHVTASAEL
jgi:hypothetical protein